MKKKPNTIKKIVKYYTIKQVNQMESEDVNNDLESIAEFDYKNDDDCREITDKRHGFEYSWTADTKPISIAELRVLLDVAEVDGATHVQIAYHPDHQVYNVDGFKIYKSTEEEIAEADKADEDYDATSFDINVLEQEINKLKEERKTNFNGKRYAYTR